MPPNVSPPPPQTDPYRLAHVIQRTIACENLLPAGTQCCRALDTTAPSTSRSQEGTISHTTTSRLAGTRITPPLAQTATSVE
eukprot:2268957-Rhodomonas_salina.2